MGGQGCLGVNRARVDNDRKKVILGDGIAGGISKQQAIVGDIIVHRIPMSKIRADHLFNRHQCITFNFIAMQKRGFRNMLGKPNLITNKRKVVIVGNIFKYSLNVSG